MTINDTTFRSTLQHAERQGQDTTKDPAAKRAALALVTKGLITQAEGARLAGVTRQLMRHWARGIPVERNREAVLAKLWDKELARNQHRSS